MARGRLFPLRGKGLDGFSTILCVLCGNKTARKRKARQALTTLCGLCGLCGRKKTASQERLTAVQPAGVARQAGRHRGAARNFLTTSPCLAGRRDFVAQRGTLNTKPETRSLAVARLLVGGIARVPYFYSLSNQPFFITKIPFLCIAFSMCCSASLCAQRSFLPVKKARRPPGSSSWTAPTTTDCTSRGSRQRPVPARPDRAL
jgi:hypothetical protein